MDDYGTGKRGGQQAVGRSVAERLAAGACHGLLCRADVGCHRQSAPCTCQWDGVVLADALGRGRLLLRRLVPVQFLPVFRLPLRTALHDPCPDVCRPVGMDLLRADAGLELADSHGGHADGYRRLSIRTGRAPHAVAAAAHEGNPLRNRGGDGTGSGTDSQQDRTGPIHG